MSSQKQKILGIDPGTARMGYGIITEEGGKTELIEFGVLTTEAGQDEHLRLGELYSGLEKLIQKHAPHAIVVEDIFYAKNQKTIIKVSQARGIALLAAARARTPFYSFTPLQIKQAVTGWGGAQKPQVQEMVRLLLGLAVTPRPDDAADALAAAICCASSRKILDKL